MFFKDDNGNIMGSADRPYYDYTQQYVVDWWTNTVTSVMNNALKNGIIVNGVFADGIGHTWNNPNISTQRANAYYAGRIQMFNQTKNAFGQINDDLFLIGNGISTYWQLPNNLDLMPYFDGMLGEHFGSFEEVEANGKINVTDLLFWFNASKSISNGVYGQNKALLIKSWVGPEVQPIDSMGPSWPKAYGTRPSTHEGIQNASTALITFPLATFLCGVYSKYVYFNYAWWYSIEQGYVPCPDDPTSCDCPLNWYDEFTAKLGEPRTDGVITDTTKCNRSFEHANVYVDLNDDSSAVIQWLD